MLYDEGIGGLSWKNVEKLHERYTNREMQGGEHVAQAWEVNTQATLEESKHLHIKVSAVTWMDLEDMIFSEIKQIYKKQCMIPLNEESEIS